jgi:hypothetical protein
MKNGTKIAEIGTTTTKNGTTMMKSAVKKVRPSIASTGLLTTLMASSLALTSILVMNAGSMQLPTANTIKDLAKK